jgi:hypothetical protein
MIAAQSADFDPRWFPLFFFGLWVTVCALLSYLAGWPALADKYRSDRDIVGQRYRAVSLSMGRFVGGVNYSNCATIRLNEEGIALSVQFLFRLFHPPLFIPWEAIVSCEETKVWFRRATRLEIRDPENRITFYGRVAKDLLAFYQARPGLSRNRGVATQARIIG